jgi:EAL domain-containing protein (putative c-di-GMP-specific phosphodiesterase class I)/GGDEF domain-containing protein
VTGLATRAVMQSTLDADVAAGRPGALALLEVDGFRALTLRRGGEDVARALRRLAMRLHELEPGRSFHLGEGGFAVVLAAAGDLVTWADDLVVDLSAIDDDVTVSIGTARAERTLTAATVEERANLALRAAQRRGNASHVDYARQDQTAPDGVTPEKAQALYDVLSAGELRVHYQPIIDLRDGRTIGFEALARPQATHGLNGPLEAFDVAARLGLVPELDALCRASIFAEGPGFDMPRHARLHVNVSPLALGHRSLSSTVLRRQLAEAGLEPRRVVFELTEEHDAEPEVTDRELRRLSKLGVGLLLDEVGAGSADLRRLRTGNFHGVKIAQAVVAETTTSRYAVGIVDAICAFARSTDTMVVAGGVEDAEMLRFVQDFRAAGDPTWRIRAAQGYHLGRPRPRAAAEAQKQAAASHG